MRWNWSCYWLLLLSVRISQDKEENVEGRKKFIWGVGNHHLDSTRLDSKTNSHEIHNVCCCVYIILNLHPFSTMKNGFVPSVLCCDDDDPYSHFITCEKDVRCEFECYFSHSTCEFQLANFLITSSHHRYRIISPFHSIPHHHNTTFRGRKFILHETTDKSTMSFHSTLKITLLNRQNQSNFIQLYAAFCKIVMKLFWLLFELILSFLVMTLCG